MKNFGELDFETNAGVFWVAGDGTVRREDLDPRSAGEDSAVTRHPRGHPLVRRFWALMLRLYRFNPRPRTHLPYL
jgi:hypothetical protein